MREKVLALLREKEGFVSGQILCRQLGVSRTAVWKYVNALKKEGYEIESVTKKGYRLIAAPDTLTPSGIRAALGRDEIRGELEVLDEVDSTNEEAKRRAAAGAADGSVYIAEVQTKGKGRRGRQWSSPRGNDLFFTMLQYPGIPAANVSMVTLVAALSAAVTVEKYAGEPAEIKWPNDIVLHGKKVCGILTEMGGELDQVAYIVIGIGFNINRTFFEEDLADMASSIWKETGKKTDRTAFFADYYRDFQKRYRRFLEEQNLAFLRKDYNKRLVNAGREVRIIQQGEPVIRQAIGIDDRGALVVQNSLGRKERIFAGEVSVRGLYGYV